MKILIPLIVIFLGLAILGRIALGVASIPDLLIGAFYGMAFWELLRRGDGR
jgi:uncharacterized membrane protein YczE